MASTVSPTEDELALAAEALTEYERLTDCYAQRWEAAEREVVEWAWYTDVAADPRPLEFERNGQPGPPGRRLDRAPLHPVGCVLHGFDSSGRVVVSRRDSSVSAAEEDFADTLFSYHPDRTDIVDYWHSGRRLIRLERLFGPLERPHAFVCAGRGHAHVYRLAYDGDRLVRLESIAGMEPGGTPELEATQHVSYAEDGSIAEVWHERADGKRFRLFPTPDAGCDDGTPPAGADELVGAFQECRGLGGTDLRRLTPRQALRTFAELVQRDAAGQEGYDFEFLLTELTTGTDTGECRLTWSVSQIPSRTDEETGQFSYFSFQCEITYPLTETLHAVPLGAEECDPDDDPAGWLADLVARPELDLLEAAEPLDVQVALLPHD